MKVTRSFWGASLIVLAASLASSPAQSPPGQDRLPVRTGSDQDVGRVSRSPVSIRVEQLVGLPRPSALPRDQPTPAFQARRIPPVETTQYEVVADIIGYQRDPNGSYSMVIQSDSGATMIVGVPGAQSIGGDWGRQAAAVRDQLDHRFGRNPGSPGTGFQRTRVRARITGVGFFGLVAGQVGVAPNGIELQPILRLEFL